MGDTAKVEAAPSADGDTVSGSSAAVAAVAAAAAAAAHAAATATDALLSATSRAARSRSASVPMYSWEYESLAFSALTCLVPCSLSRRSRWPLECSVTMSVTVRLDEVGFHSGEASRYAPKRGCAVREMYRQPCASQRAPVASDSRGPMLSPWNSGSTTSRLSRRTVRDSSKERPASLTPGCGMTATKPTGRSPHRSTAHAAVTESSDET